MTYIYYITVIKKTILLDGFFYNYKLYNYGQTELFPVIIVSSFAVPVLSTQKPVAGDVGDFVGTYTAQAIPPAAIPHVPDVEVLLYAFSAATTIPAILFV